MDTTTLSESQQAVVEASNAAFAHADTCRKCCQPIVNEEGNPGFLSEACKEGRILLVALLNAEATHFGRKS